MAQVLQFPVFAQKARLLAADLNGALQKLLAVVGGVYVPPAGAPVRYPGAIGADNFAPGFRVRPSQVAEGRTLFPFVLALGGAEELLPFVGRIVRVQCESNDNTGAGVTITLDGLAYGFDRSSGIAVAGGPNGPVVNWTTGMPVKAGSRAHVSAHPAGARVTVWVAADHVA